MGFDLLLKIPDLLFVLRSLIHKNLLVLRHFVHKMLLLLGKIQFEIVVHIIVESFRWIGVVLFAFDESLDVLLQLINVNFIFLLSSLVLLHFVISSCKIPLVLLYGLLKQLYFLSYIFNNLVLNLHTFPKPIILLLSFPQLHTQIFLLLIGNLPHYVSLILKFLHLVFVELNIAIGLRLVINVWPIQRVFLLFLQIGMRTISQMFKIGWSMRRFWSWILTDNGRYRSIGLFQYFLRSPLGCLVFSVVLPYHLSLHHLCIDPQLYWWFLLLSHFDWRRFLSPNFFAFFVQQRRMQFLLMLKHLSIILFVETNPQSQVVIAFLLAMLHRVNRTDGIALPNKNIPDPLFLQSDQRIRFNPGLIVTQTKFTISIFAPDPSLTLISHSISIISTHLYTYKMLSQLTKWYRTVKSLLIVLTPNEQPSIHPNPYKIFSCWYVFEIYL